MDDSAIAILAGGLGTRLQDELLGKPKALAPLARGKSLLELVVEASLQRRIPITIVTDRRSSTVLHEAVEIDAIEWIVDDGVGTGEAVRALLHGGTHERYVLMNCDTLTPFRVLDLVNAVPSATPIRQHLTRHSSQNDGLIGLDAHAEMVVHWGETSQQKPDFKLEPASSSGVYEIHRKAIQHFPPYSDSFENQILPHLVAQGDLASVLHPSEKPTIDFGTRPSYHRLQSAPAQKYGLLREMGLLWI